MAGWLPGFNLTIILVWRTNRFGAGGTGVKAQILTMQMFPLTGQRTTRSIKDAESHLFRIHHTLSSSSNHHGYREAEQVWFQGHDMWLVHFNRMFSKP